EARLREELDIPVFHDDQHGTAIVCLAAMRNALAVVGKKLEEVTLVMSGAGAAGTAILKLLLYAGLRNVVVADMHGVIHTGREDVLSGDHPNQTWIAENTNPQGLSGTLVEALAGADVFLGVSAPNILTGDDIATMADDAVVFAMANPTPEVDPIEASKHAAVVATGRSDFSNQINNVLVFPGVFRGLLDSGSKVLTPEVLLAAADALAAVVKDEERNATYIIPSVFHPDVAGVVAAAVAKAALAAAGTVPVAKVSDGPVSVSASAPATA
ncbi:MAG: NAD-dependent malic enzyme, partial [Knoellia sp.]